MAKLTFKNNQVEDFTFILSTRSYKHLGQISNIDGINCALSLNSPDTINFSVHKTLDNHTEALWNEVTDLRLIYVKELNEYFEINVTLNDYSTDITKEIVATSLCESELSQYNIKGLEVNTEDDIARSDYVVTTFYNPNNAKASLLNRVLNASNISHYKIGHVDNSLYEIQRSFSVDGTTVYDFLTGDCASQFNCLFLFDSMTRTINVYDLYTNCNNPECNYRGEFDDVCPVCGGNDISYFGEDTTIYVDKQNLTDSITFETDMGSVKNCFKIVGGDDNITAAIRNVNPNGTDIIYYISDEQKKDMSDALNSALKSYDKLCSDYNDKYISVNENIYEALDKILYYTSEMMPTIEHAETNATKEAAKLTEANLSPLGLTSVTTSTSVATVNSALKSYAKVYIKSGYFKVEIDTDTGVTNSFEYVGTDADGNHYGTWYGRFKVTNYSDEEDVAVSEYIQVKVYDLYGDFLKQKIRKSIAQDDADSEDGNIYDVLSIKDLTKFKDALTHYCLNRLTSFYDAIQSVLDILVEEDQASNGADWYEGIYVPYYDKLQACQSEIDKRQATINTWTRSKDSYIEQRTNIQNILNFEKYLGTDLYNEFCSYKREDVYSNDNYISDGLSSSEVLEKAQELLETAKEELVKSGTRQHSISSNLYNLLCMKEFKPIVDMFDLGNWIRINVDGTIYRLRLIGYTIDFDNIQNINVTFSDVTKTQNCRSDIDSILSQAKSIASNYSYIAKQASKGESANSSINAVLRDGFNASLAMVKNADSEEVTIGKNGIRLKRYDDINDWYDPEQAAFIHNTLVFTDDNWRTVATAMGKIQFTLDGTKHESYGVNATHIIAGTMVAGDIYSGNYSSTNKVGTHLDLETGSFVFGGDRIVFDSYTNELVLNNVLVKMTDGSNTSLTKVITDANAVVARVDHIEADYADIGSLHALEAKIDKITSNEITTEYLKANYATIEELEATNATIKNLDAVYATIDNLNATNANIKKLNAEKADIKYLESKYATIENLNATNGKIETLESKSITTENLDANIANIDLAHIKKLYANSAIITSLEAEFATVGSLNATNAAIGKLDTVYATIANLNAAVGRIDKLESTSITTGNLDANIANIDLAHIKELYADSAFITSLTSMTQNTIISTVDTQMVKDLIAGHATINDLFTNNFTIGSDRNGSVKINGSTMQFNDAKGNTYVQLGTDAKGGHSLIVKDSNGTVLLNGSGITENAIADGLIVDKMVKKKDTTYSGISADALNIDSVVTGINSSSTTIKSSQIYFDEEGQSLNTKLVNMTNKLSEEIDNKVSKNGVYSSYIESTNGNILTNNKGTVLSVVLKKGNDVIDADGKLYRYAWRRTTTNGVMDNWSAIGKTVTVESNAFTGNITYIVDIMESSTITDTNGNVLTDASSNVLEAYLPIISSSITLYKDIDEKLTTNYYTKKETTSEVITILGTTDISKINGKESSIVSTINTTKDTVASHSQTLTQQATDIESVTTKAATIEQDLNGFKISVGKTYETKDHLTTNYYTKTETPDAVVKVLSNTDVSKIDGKEFSVINEINTTKATVAGYETRISKTEKDTSAINTWKGEFVTQYNKFTASVSKTYATNKKVDELANGNNLLRNSDTLIFEGYSLGAKLVDASGNVLTDANGNFVVA